MRQAFDSAADILSCLTPDQQRQAGHITMPYLGYLFFRETITTALLGESEAAILYWMGKDAGKKLSPRHPEDIIFSFIRLGLGQLDLKNLNPETGEALFELRHNSYQLRTKERLQRSLQLEAGMLAGAMGKLWQKELEASLHIQEKEHKKEPYAEIRLNSL